MIWLLNSQGMKNCKITESFCRSILAIYTNDSSSVWYVCCCYVYFHSGKFLNVCEPRTTTSLLTARSTWIGILRKWTSMLTKLAGDGECTLALFHVIRNFLANKIYHFSRMYHQATFFIWAACSIQSAPYSATRLWDYLEHFGIYYQPHRTDKTWFFIILNV